MSNKPQNQQQNPNILRADSIANITLVIRKRQVQSVKKLPPVGTVYLVINRTQNLIKASSGQTGRSILFRNTETSFVTFIRRYYGPGNYTIICRSGRQKGFRRFWNGIILLDKYMRFPSDPDIGFMDTLFNKYIKANPPNRYYSIL